MKKEDLVFLDQLVKSLDESEVELENFYKNSDFENFNQVKKFMLKIQKRISETTNDI